MRIRVVAVMLMLLSASALSAEEFSRAQITAVENLWDTIFDCADDAGTCENVGPAARAFLAAGLCADANRLVPCGTAAGKPFAIKDQPDDAGRVTRGSDGRFHVDGLETINPEWHEAIAAGQCLTAAGFGECAAIEPFAPTADGHFYQGPTVEASRLLTRFNIYNIECRGAGGAINIDGWCGKRTAAVDGLVHEGVCLGDAGFRLCGAEDAGNLPIFGTWICDGSVIRISATTYSMGADDPGIPITAIKERDNSFLIEMANGAYFVALYFTPTSFTWYSPRSGDSFECHR